MELPITCFAACCSRGWRGCNTLLASTPDAASVYTCRHTDSFKIESLHMFYVRVRCMQQMRHIHICASIWWLNIGGLMQPDERLSSASPRSGEECWHKCRSTFKVLLDLSLKCCELKEWPAALAPATQLRSLSISNWPHSDGLISLTVAVVAALSTLPKLEMLHRQLPVIVSSVGEQQWAELLAQLRAAFVAAGRVPPAISG